MGLGFTFNLLPTFQPGEKVLFMKKRVGFCTCLSSPSYRWSFSLPPLQEQALFITDRRVLHVLHNLRILTAEFAQWYDAKEVKDTEFIKEVRTGRHWLCGPCVEIVSESAKKLWYRSRKARMRLYMKDVELAYKIIAEAMVENTGVNAK